MQAEQGRGGSLHLGVKKSTKLDTELWSLILEVPVWWEHYSGSTTAGALPQEHCTGSTAVGALQRETWEHYSGSTAASRLPGALGCSGLCDTQWLRLVTLPLSPAVNRHECTRPGRFVSAGVWCGPASMGERPPAPRPGDSMQW